MTDEFNAFNPFDEVENDSTEEPVGSSEVSFEDEKDRIRKNLMKKN